jgi:two-component system, cell cycle response regulator
VSVARIGAQRNERELASFAASQILQAAVREDVSLTELRLLAEADPAFMMRLLAMVNSAAYRGAATVSDIAQAIALLGLRGTRAVALGMVVADLAPLGEDGTTLLANCIRRAIAARLLGEAVDGRTASEYFFTTGLLLDAGLLVSTPELLVAAVQLSRSPAADRVVRERAACREPHTSVGASLAEQYALPRAVIRAIKLHHSRDVPDDPLAAVAWAAERVAGVFEGGEFELNRRRACDAGHELGLSEREVNGILSVLPELVAQSAVAFRRELGPQPNIGDLVNDARHQLVDMTRQYVELVSALERVLEEKERLAERLQQANDTLQHLAATDALTGLPNRRSFQESMLRELARAARERTPMSLVMIDIDHFKSFNDRYGHATGDEVLRITAQTLRQQIRACDALARLGGEEFSVILPNTDLDGALVLTERIRAAIEAQLVPAHPEPLRVTASFGIAGVLEPSFEDLPEALFERADAALYRAKGDGRNCVRVGYLRASNDP